MINKHANQMCLFLLLNVNDYQPSSLQVVGDHSAIIMGPVLSILLLVCFLMYVIVRMLYICSVSIVYIIM